MVGSVTGIAWWAIRRIAKREQSKGFLLVSRGFLVSLFASAAWTLTFWTIFDGPYLSFDLYSAGLSQAFISLVSIMIYWAGYVILVGGFFTMSCFIVCGISILVPPDSSSSGIVQGSLLFNRLARAGRGALSGVIAGMVWGGTSILGQFAFFLIFHDAILANVQSSIPSPQPLLPGFPEFGFTQPPDPGQLIAAFAYTTAIITLILGLFVGGVFGLVMAIFKTQQSRVGSVVLKSNLLGLATWAVYTIPSLFESTPLGEDARLFATGTGFVSALVSSSVLGTLYWRITPRTNVDSQSVKLVTGSPS